MHLQLLLTLGALAVQVQCRAVGSLKRSDPKLLTDRLTKRGDPGFVDGEYGENDDGDDKRHLLERAIPDVYRLVSTSLRHWDDEIFSRWFPISDKDNVMAAFHAIIPDEHNHPGRGGDVLQNFVVTPQDFQAGLGEQDLCARNADAYTQNQITSVPQGNVLWSLTHFCPAAFAENQAPRLRDLKCKYFQFEETGRFRITDEMDTLGATMLHEMMHFNRIGSLTGLTEVDDEGSIITDVTDPGKPWESYHLRQMYNDNPSDLCIRNADSYVWFALESYWTHKCADKFDDDQNGRFDPPLSPGA